MVLDVLFRFYSTGVTGGLIRHASIFQSEICACWCAISNMGGGSAIGTAICERQRRKRSDGNTYFTISNVMTLCKKRQLKDALHALHFMEEEGIRADSDTYASLLQVCIDMKALEEGKQIHAHITKCQFKPGIFIGNALVRMYAKCGSVMDARQIFDNMPERDVITWSAMIAGYAHHGNSEEALQLFWKMQGENVKPKYGTFLSVLKACASLTVLEMGMQVHACIIRCGLESELFVGNALIDMYSKCRSVVDARQVFDNMPKRDVVTWSAMIAGYAHHGHGEEALQLFWKMEGENVKPNYVTFLCVLKACAGLTVLEKGMQVHAYIIECGLGSEYLLANALIDMYTKCRSVEHAQRVFDRMVKRDVVSWTAMIAGYVQYGNGEEALKLFWQMEQDTVKPNAVTFANTIRACTFLSALEQGYARHGYGEVVLELFQEMQLEAVNPNNVTFISVLKACASLAALGQGYSQHGFIEEALQLFWQMQQESVKPSAATFTCVLSACSRVGLVDEGCCYFDSMKRDHSISPTAEHYSCMVDLFGRAGQLEEAENFVKKMPFQPTVDLWGTLLGACRIHSDIESAKHVAEYILELEPQNATAFVLLSNAYAAASKWDDKEKVRKLMDGRGLTKQLGCTWIEVKNQVHLFVMDDTLHPNNRIP